MPPTSHRHRWLAAAAALVVAAAGVTAWAAFVRGGEPVPRLIWPDPDGGFAIAVPYSTNPAPWSFGTLTMCTDTRGPVTVTGVTPMGGSGITPVSVATRPATNHLFGDSQRSLAQEGFRTPAVVDVPCASGGHTELAVSLQRSGTQDATFDWLRVSYVSEGKQLTLKIPWQLKLCGPGHTTDKTCTLS